jgi:hypothetical protein
MLLFRKKGMLHFGREATGIPLFFHLATKAVQGYCKQLWTYDASAS